MRNAQDNMGHCTLVKMTETFAGLNGQTVRAIQNI